MNFLDFPRDIINEIVVILPVRDLLCVRCVCWDLKYIIQQHKLWKQLALVEIAKKETKRFSKESTWFQTWMKYHIMNFLNSYQLLFKASDKMEDYIQSLKDKRTSAGKKIIYYDEQIDIKSQQLDEMSRKLSLVSPMREYIEINKLSKKCRPVKKMKLDISNVE